jgi:hypothetical protein
MSKIIWTILSSQRMQISHRAEESQLQEAVSHAVAVKGNKFGTTHQPS